MIISVRYIELGMEVACPKCKKSDQQYREVCENEEHTLELYCWLCGHEWSQKIIFSTSLKMLPSEDLSEKPLTEQELEILQLELPFDE